MNEIVQYSNDWNSLKFTGFSKADMNVLMYLCSQVREQGTKNIVIGFEDIRQNANFTSPGIKELIEELDRVSDNLLKVNSKIILKNDDGKRRIIKFDLFPTFDIDEDQQTLTVAVNERFQWLLNEFTAYTIFELSEFVGLKSKYSKTLYRLLKQWRTVGAFAFHDVEEFRQQMDVPKSYSNNIFLRDCISPAVAELAKLDSSFKGLKCEVLKARKRGAPVTGYRFTWQAEKRQPKSIEQPEAPTEAPETKKASKPKTQKPKTNRFNNFHQRNYTKEQLDRMFQ